MSRREQQAIFDSDEWIEYALNLVDTHRGLGHHALSLEPQARRLEDALLPGLAGAEIAGLLERAQRLELAERTAATRLLLRLVVAGDARIAEARSQVTDVCAALAATDYPQLPAGRLALAAWLELDPDRALRFWKRHWSLGGVLPLEAELRCPIAGGGELVLGPGTVACDVGLLEPPPPGYEDEHVWFVARVELADAQGRLLRADVPFSSHAFVEMLHHGAPTRPGSGTPLLPEVRCFSDRRRWLPILVQSAGTWKAYAYWEKYLHLTVSLRRGDAGMPALVLDVPPREIGGVGADPVPAAAVAGDLLVRSILAPLDPLRGSPHSVTFRLTGEVGRPQAGVRAEGADPAPVRERFRWKTVLERVVLENSAVSWEATIAAGWLAGVDHAAAELALMTIDSTDRQGRAVVMPTLEHLARHFGSERALERLRELSRGTGDAADQAHSCLSRLGHADASRIAQELEEYKRTRSGTALRWIGAVGQSIKLEGETVDAVFGRVRQQLGPPSAETPTGLTYQASDDSGWMLHVGVVAVGNSTFRAHIAAGRNPRRTKPDERQPAQRTVSFEPRADLRFRIDDDRILEVRRGRVECGFDIVASEPFEIGTEASTVALALDLADAQGRVFRATRPLTSAMLADCWEPGHVGHLDELAATWRYPKAPAALERVAIQWGADVRLVVAAPHHDEDEKQSLWKPALLELSGRTTESAVWISTAARALLLRVILDEPGRSVGLLSCGPLATMVLMPALLGRAARAGEQARWVDTGRIARPNPGVRVRSLGGVPDDVAPM
ncbi:MAG: hypothetical protein IT305_21870 [Chloroflexi bacterium]|nr:hypothetical protein [Chloroflexota bacterium]